MSPKFSMMLVLLGVMSWPTAAWCAVQNTPVAGTSKQSLPAETQRSQTRDDATRVAEVDVIRKNFTIDLSHLPLPLSYGLVAIGAFHVFPAQEPGPYIGPPTRIWGMGFGTSLWRNPVTGWPEM